MASASDPQLEKFRLSLEWFAEEAREFVTESFTGASDELLVVAQSRTVCEVALEDLSGRRPLEQQCGLYRLGPHDYRLRIRMKAGGETPRKRIAAFRLLAAPGLTRIAEEIHQEAVAVSSWSGPRAAERLGWIAGRMEEIVGQLRAYRAFRVPGSPKLDEVAIADDLEGILRQILTSVGDVNLSTIADLYGRLADVAAGEFEVVSQRAKCLQARARAGHLRLFAQRWAGEAPALVDVHEMTEYVVELVGEGVPNACCRMELIEFPKTSIESTLRRMIEMTSEFAVADFCKRVDEHQQRIAYHERFLEALEQSCWLEPEAKQRLDNALAVIRRKVKVSADLKNGVEPPELERLRQELGSLEQQAWTAMKSLDRDALTGVRSSLARLNLSYSAQEMIEDDCTRAAVARIGKSYDLIAARHRQLRQRLDWFDQLAQADWLVRSELPSCAEIMALPRDRQSLEVVCAAVSGAVGAYEQRNDCSTMRRVETFLACDRDLCPRATRRLDSLKSRCEVAELRQWIHDLLDTKAREGTCEACAAMDREIERLESDPRREQIAEEVKRPNGAYEKALREASRRILEGMDSTECDLRRLDPRPVGWTGDCCGLSDQYLDRLKNDRLQNCCSRAAQRFQGDLAAGREQIEAASQLAHLSWAEFTAKVAAIDRLLGDLRRTAVELGRLCRSGGTGVQPLKDQWRRTLLADTGIYDKLRRYIWGKISSPFDDSPSGDAIVTWANRFASRGDLEREWSVLLRLTDLVRDVTDQCPGEGDSLSREVSTKYNEIKRYKDELNRRFGHEVLRQRASEVIADAETCMSPFDHRDLEIRLDSTSSYSGSISPARYDILDRARLIKLIVIPPQRSADRRLGKLTNITVEFFTRGFEISARLIGGREDTSRDRRGGYEGRSVEGLDAYRFEERLPADPYQSRMYYQIKPTAASGPRKLFLRIVPRAF